jgi:hypothetical protein
MQPENCKVANQIWVMFVLFNEDDRGRWYQSHTYSGQRNQMSEDGKMGWFEEAASRSSAPKKEV